jgi:hypothetical protein
VALARANTWQRLLLSGEYASVHQLAANLGCDPSSIARTMNLALFAPGITFLLVWSAQWELLGID